jgi:hypothetical protein
MDENLQAVVPAPRGYLMPIAEARAARGVTGQAALRMPALAAHGTADRRR